jgi:hypothetical protein
MARRRVLVHELTERCASLEAQEAVWREQHAQLMALEQLRRRDALEVDHARMLEKRRLEAIEREERLRWVSTQEESARAWMARQEQVCAAHR